MATYNVVLDYSWTSVPKGSKLRKEAPRVHLRSYKLAKNQIRNLAGNYLSIAKNEDGDTYYRNLYKTEGEGGRKGVDDFYFPFFGDNVRSISNNFADAFSGGTAHGTSHIGSNLTNLINSFGGATAGLIGQAKAMAANAPGSYTETPKFYQYEESDMPIQIAFILSNTIEEGDHEKNYQLIRRLMWVNRPVRNDAFIMDPPALFAAKVPGYRYIEWGYCSSLQISLLGTRRVIDKKIIPEAYQVDMTISSLTVEARNFLKKV